MGRQYRRFPKPLTLLILIGSGQQKLTLTHLVCRYPRTATRQLVRIGGVVAFGPYHAAAAAVGISYDDLVDGSAVAQSLSGR